MTPKSASGNSGHLLIVPNCICSGVSAATVMIHLFDLARIFFFKSCFDISVNCCLVSLTLMAIIFAGGGLDKLHFDVIGISESRIKKDKSPINNINLEGYCYKSCPTESSVGGYLS